MKNLSIFSLAIAVAVTTSGLTFAEELKSGPQSGDRIGAFNVTKVAGAEDDGVDIGQELCYRCRNGARPQVIVFTRSSDDAKIKELVQKLDKAVAENESAQLRVFVNVLGDSKEDLTDAAKNLAGASNAKNVPIVVPNEFENGPDNYGINPKTEVTVTMATNSTVKATHSAAKAGDLDVNAVLKDLNKILE